MKQAYSLLMVLLILPYSSLSQNTSTTRFAIHAGLSSPVGGFIRSGPASTGFAAGGYVVMTNVGEFSALASLMYSTLPVDAPSQLNIHTRLSNWTLMHVLVGIRGIRIINDRTDKFYALLQTGVVFARSPAVTYDYLAREAIGTGNVGFVADGSHSNALTIGAGVGLLFTQDNIDRYDLRLQMLYAEPVFGFGESARRVVVQQVQVQVGLVFD